MIDAAVLIPLFPLAGFLTLVAFGKRLGDPIAGWIATTAMGGAFVSACVAFAGLGSVVGREFPDRANVTVGAIGAKSARSVEARLSGPGAFSTARTPRTANASQLTRTACGLG